MRHRCAIAANWQRVIITTEDSTVHATPATEEMDSTATVISNLLNHHLKLTYAAHRVWAGCFCIKCLHQTAPPVICWRGSSASPLCIDIIACCPTHPSFNHIGDRAFPVAAARLWNTVAERHVGIVNICFQETFEDPSLQSFFPPESPVGCSACAVTLSLQTLWSIFFYFNYILIYC